MHPFDPGALAAIGPAPAPGDHIIIVRVNAGQLSVQSNIVTDQRGLSQILEQCAADLRADADNITPSGIVLP